MSSVEFAPACEADDPDDDEQQCTKPVNHGGLWHGNAETYWRT